jgi:hypothetical protein
VILDEQQAVDDNRRDRVEIVVYPFGIACLTKRGLVAIEELQPGTRLLAVNRVATLVDELVERLRPFGLAPDDEMVGALRLDEGRQPVITKPLRAPFGKAGRLAPAGPNCKIHISGQACEETGLQVRGAQLRRETPAQHKQRGEYCRPAEDRHGAQQQTAPAVQFAPIISIARQKTPPNRLDHHRCLVIFTQW